MAKDKAYLISEKMTRNLLLLMGAGMIGLFVALIVLTVARPQGKFVEHNTSIHDSLVAKATEQLNNFHENEDGSISIPITTAMDIVAKNGLNSVSASTDNLAASSKGPADGEAVYSSNCQSCHQANGLGIPGAFPPLAGNAVNLAKNNRDYLPTVVLNGLTGAIEVDGQSFNGAMPAWKHLSDNEIAAVLNHIVSTWDDSGVAKFDADEIANIRTKSYTNDDILKMRSNGSDTSETSGESESAISTASETPAQTTTATTTSATATTAAAASTTAETTTTEAGNTETNTIDITHGASVYKTNCVSCHQASGQGIPGAFPPLANNIVKYSDTNREYLIAAVVGGLSGKIDVNGQEFNGAMPAWKNLSDEDIAEVLNYAIVNWDKPKSFTAFTAEEVATVRAKKLPLDDVLKLRKVGSSPSETSPAATETATPGFDWKKTGETAYANCQACHQANGNGLPGAFPALNKNAAKLFKGNRDYLALAVLSGLNGEIEVDGQKYNGAMPSWKQLSDEQIAAVLNHVLSSWDNSAELGDFDIYTPAQIKEYRDLGLNAEEVKSLRP